MKVKKYLILLVMIGVIFLTGLWAVDAPGDYKEILRRRGWDFEKFQKLERLRKEQSELILKGLVGVTPEATIFSAEDVPCRLREYELQTKVELRLRQSGIKVFSETTEKDSNSFSALRVHVTLRTFKPLAPAYVVESHVELSEPVWLFRDRQKFTIATTWEGFPYSSCLREVPTRTEILEVVNGSVDEFISDYLAANPKE